MSFQALHRYSLELRTFADRKEPGDLNEVFAVLDPGCQGARVPGATCQAVFSSNLLPPDEVTAED